MPETDWQPLPPHLHSEMRFKMALLIAHRQIFERHFATDPAINRALGFHLHGYRQQNNWRIVLILTPWMFSRLLFAETPPDIPIPEGWRADQRAGADYQVLGPVVDLPTQNGALKAHLNYHLTLGHYLLQPIALNLEPYNDAEDVFRAWNEVIELRDERLKQMEQQCDWQQEISRREFLRARRGCSD
jgi:hypothetical protein